MVSRMDATATLGATTLPLLGSATSGGSADISPQFSQPCHENGTLRLGLCAECGEPLIVRHTGRPRRYCSDRCRTNAKRKRDKVRRRRELGPPVGEYRDGMSTVELERLALKRLCKAFFDPLCPARSLAPLSVRMLEMAERLEAASAAEADAGLFDGMGEGR